MNKAPLAPIRTWLAAPMGKDVSEAIERLRRAPDVQQVAVMPDVHLASDVCIGVVLATTHFIYPQAVGGDIGCGILAVALDLEASFLATPGVAAQILTELGRAAPARRRNRAALIEPPRDLADTSLSDVRLEVVRRDEGALEFATLGSGNHFIEIQADDDDRPWLTVHSGSRVLGQRIRDFHLAQAEPVDGRLRALDANSNAGIAYLHDAAWARRFADASRKAMAEEVGRMLARLLGAKLRWETLITTDHNHVSRERFEGRDLWIHRKGAMPAHAGQGGVLPGSMRTISFHVEGRGHEAALCSSAHGAGRAFSRPQAG